ncbi:MAG: hypothetical protein QQN63_05730 [Nitrosopumilus sp.]
MMSILSDKITGTCMEINDQVKIAKVKGLMVEIRVGNSSLFIHPNDKDETVPQLEVYTWKRQ